MEPNAVNAVVERLVRVVFELPVRIFTVRFEAVAGPARFVAPYIFTIFIDVLPWNVALPAMSR